MWKISKILMIIGILSVDNIHGLPNVHMRAAPLMEEMNEKMADMTKHMFSYAYTTGDWAKAEGSSGLTFDTPQRMQTMETDLLDNSNRMIQMQSQSQSQSQHGALGSTHLARDGFQQMAAIHPEHGVPNTLNLITPLEGGNVKYYSVRSSSSSSNDNGVVRQHAETIVDDNGHITKYVNDNPAGEITTFVM